MPTPLDLNKTGPLIGNFQGRRVKSRYACNQTASLVDHHFPNFRPTETNFKSLSSESELVNCYKGDNGIEQHVDRRILYFFLQLVVTYKTGLHYEIGKTMAQGDSISGLTITHLERRNAAHSSTIPCLYAYDLEAWKTYENNNGTKPEGRLFLIDTHIWNCWNTTIAMTHHINDADRAIDEKYRSSNLRQKAISIINDSSQGKITPQLGIKRFIQDLIDEISINKKREKEGECKALELYEKRIKNLSLTNKDFLTWMDLFFNLSDLDQKVQLAAFQLRIKSIQDDQLNQRKILEKIENIRSQILSKFEIKPPLFEEVFRNMIINKVSSQSHISLQKLFNTPNMINPQPEDINKIAETKQGKQAIKDFFKMEKFSYSTITNKLSTSDDRENIMKFLENYYAEYPAIAEWEKRELRQCNSHVTHFKNTCQKLQKYNKKFQKLGEELNRKLTTIRHNTEAKRGSIIRVLRKEKGWIQQDLAQAIKERFPTEWRTEKTLISVLSRIENGFVRIDDSLAEKTARALGVPLALVLPHFFSD